MESLDSTSSKFKIKKEINLIGAVSLISGVILGSGIFMTPGSILLLTGSVGSSLIIWAFGGVFTLMCGLCYCELGLLVKESAGEYAYLLRIYHDIMGYFFAVINIFVSAPCSLVVMTYTCSTYIVALFYPGCEGSIALIKIGTILVIIAVSSVNYYSMRLSMRIQNVTFYLKLVPIFVILLAGAVEVGRGNTANLTNPFENNATDWAIYSKAMYSLWCENSVTANIS